MRPIVLFSLLLLSCASVFRNPDLAGGAGPKNRNAVRIALNNIQDREGEILRNLKSGIVTPQEFSWMQNHAVDLVLSLNGSGGPGLNDLGFQADMEQENRGKDRAWTFNHAGHLTEALSRGFSVIEIRHAASDDLLNILNAGQPVLGFGRVRFSHRLTTDAKVMVYLDCDGFTLIGGFEKYRAPGRPQPGRSSDRIRFFTRNGFDLIADGNAQMIGKAFDMANPPGPRGNWQMRVFYVLMPDSLAAQQIEAVANEAGPAFEYRIINDAGDGALADPRGGRFSYYTEKIKDEEKKEEPRPGQPVVPPVLPGLMVP